MPTHHARHVLSVQASVRIDMESGVGTKDVRKPSKLLLVMQRSSSSCTRETEHVVCRSRARGPSSVHPFLKAPPNNKGTLSCRQLSAGGMLKGPTAATVAVHTEAWPASRAHVLVARTVGEVASLCVRAENDQKRAHSSHCQGPAHQVLQLVFVHASA
jgi:hypothetical protein